MSVKEEIDVGIIAGGHVIKKVDVWSIVEVCFCVCVMEKIGGEKLLEWV